MVWPNSCLGVIPIGLGATQNAAILEKEDDKETIDLAAGNGNLLVEKSKILQLMTNQEDARACHNEILNSPTSREKTIRDVSEDPTEVFYFSYFETKKA